MQFRERCKLGLAAVAAGGVLAVSSAAPAVAFDRDGRGSDERGSHARWWHWVWPWADDSPVPERSDGGGSGSTTAPTRQAAPSKAPASTPSGAPSTSTPTAAAPATGVPTAAASPSSTAVSPSSTAVSPSSTTGSASVGGSQADQVVRLTNEQRRANGCSNDLVVDAALTSAAQGHSEEMARTGVMTHDSADGSSAFDRMAAAGYDGGSAAENVAAGQPSAQEVVDSWMGSAGHRANILNCSYEDIGVGVDDDYWTQDFGTR